MVSAIIPARYAGLLFGALMAASMSVPMSVVMLMANGGLELAWGDFMGAWARGAGTGFLCAFPIALLVSPPIRRLVERVTGAAEPDDKER